MGIECYISLEKNYFIAYLSSWSAVHRGCCPPLRFITIAQKHRSIARVTTIGITDTNTGIRMLLFSSLEAVGLTVVEVCAVGSIAIFISLDDRGKTNDIYKAQK